MGHRRVTDIDKTQEIEALIVRTENQETKTLLLVVHSLNNSIREGTAAQLAKNAEDALHRKQLEEALIQIAARTQGIEDYINQGKGARVVLGWGWKIVVGLFAAMNTIVIALGSHYISEMNDLRDMAQANAVQHAEIYARMGIKSAEITK